MSGGGVSLSEVRNMQLDRLRRGVDELLDSNSFYRGRLHPVRTWADFEQLPFTTKAELVADQGAAPPFGTNLTYPLERYVRVHQTSGSSGGRQMCWLDTAESWDWWRRVWAEHVYRAAGVTPSDRVFLAFSFGPFIGFWSAFAGSEFLGAMTMAGGSMNTEQRLHAIVDFGATVLLCTPTYALRLAEVAVDLGVDLRASPVRVTVHAGEAGASIPATRALIEDAYGARCFDHTGMTELGPTGFSCQAGGGVHLVESEFVLEVIPEGTVAIPGVTASEGRGELVATNLGRWGSPVVRYRTGDIVDLSRDGCSCGSSFPLATGGILGRVDDMFTVRGVNLYPAQVEEVIHRYTEVLEFQICHKKNRHMDEVTLLLEVGHHQPETLEAISSELRRLLGVRIDCSPVEPGTLPRSELKSRRLVRVEDVRQSDLEP